MVILKIQLQLALFLWYASCGGVREWCVAWWHSGREEYYEPDPEEPSDPGYATPVSIETPLQSSVSRCTSLNVIRDPYMTTTEGRTSPLPPTYLSHASSPPTTQDSVYTILIRLPGDADKDGQDRTPSIKMISEDIPLAIAHKACSLKVDMQLDPLSRRASHASHMRIPLNAKIIPKQLAEKPVAISAQARQQAKKKKKTQEKKQETKAAKTLSAILLSFIITWTPYNILVLLKPLTACTGCIPQELWDFFYALCYINSTINPMCYALCNASFRRTYVRILTCKWHNRNREAMTRGVYN